MRGVGQEHADIARRQPSRHIGGPQKAANRPDPRERRLRPARLRPEREHDHRHVLGLCHGPGDVLLDDLLERARDPPPLGGAGQAVGHGSEPGAQRGGRRLQQAFVAACERTPDALNPDGRGVGRCHVHRQHEARLIAVALVPTTGRDRARHQGARRRADGQGARAVAAHDDERSGAAKRRRKILHRHVRRLFERLGRRQQMLHHRPRQTRRLHGRHLAERLTEDAQIDGQAGLVSGIRAPRGHDQPVGDRTALQTGDQETGVIVWRTGEPETRAGRRIEASHGVHSRQRRAIECEWRARAIRARQRHVPSEAPVEVAEIRPGLRVLPDREGVDEDAHELAFGRPGRGLVEQAMQRREAMELRGVGGRRGGAGYIQRAREPPANARQLAFVSCTVVGVLIGHEQGADCGAACADDRGARDLRAVDGDDLLLQRLQAAGDRRLQLLVIEIQTPDRGHVAFGRCRQQGRQLGIDELDRQIEPAPHVEQPRPRAAVRQHVEIRAGRGDLGQRWPLYNIGANPSGGGRPAPQTSDVCLKDDYRRAFSRPSAGRGARGGCTWGR